ncbi:HD-GYP domain-containing protein [Luteimonas kalidii]|uniref:HD-GYP domain-containing protein n=1 Tax=Luteimonas kalidii TaxID=3042025 RepID=A0ABT6JTM4_9GAMM|nr:HD-GYP domain-containing protein [Luteimonas kalidii]MDH5833820.1 HD-GYP domain-containing protein [Luteimonas kalidii]
MTRAPSDVPFSMELCISTAGLQAGMYISRLDRPWQDAGFAFEGWLVRTEDEVHRVRAACRQVHVDVLRGKSPDTRHVILDDGPESSPDATPGVEPREVPAAAAAPVPALSIVPCPVPVASAPVLDGWASMPDAPAEASVTQPPVAASPVRNNATAVFGAELAAAETAHATLDASIRLVLDTARSDETLTAAGLQEGVDAMLDSLDRNPAALSWVVEMQRKGDYIYRHGVACSIWAATFARHIGLERDDLRDLAIAALLCDVGKVRIPSELLLKQGPLQQDELRILRAHVEESRAIVGAISGLSPAVARMVGQHHERHDGSGYPRRLGGSQILLGSRILGLVDSYDAMISDRGYASRRSPHQAMMELYQTRDRLFEGALVEQFIRICGVYPTGTLVELSDGSVGVVMAVNALQRLRPTLMRVLDADKRLLAEFEVIDLGTLETDAAGAPLGVRGGLSLGAYGLDPAMLFLD